MLRSVCAIAVVLALSGCGKRDEDTDQASFAAAPANAAVVTHIGYVNTRAPVAVNHYGYTRVTPYGVKHVGYTRVWR